LSPDGLVNVICHFEVPEMSSETVKCMVTGTGPAVVSIELVDRENAVIVGGVVSTIELT
jgi:hypothetical protein